MKDMVSKRKSTNLFENILYANTQVLLMWFRVLNVVVFSKTLQTYFVLYGILFTILYNLVLYSFELYTYKCIA